VKTPECVDCPAHDLPVTSVSCSLCDHLAHYKAYRPYLNRKDIRQKPQSLDKEVSGQGERLNRGKKQAMTKAEVEYMLILQTEFPMCPVLFEAMTLKLRNGHKYTADFCVITDGKILLVEVKQKAKNNFRHPSYNRSKMAFSQAGIDFPVFSYRWAEKTVTGWTVKG